MPLSAHFGPQCLQDLADSRHIAHAWDITQARFPRRQQQTRHDRQDGILRPAHPHMPVKLDSTFDLDAIRAYRTSWGVFRDRRPEMYRSLMTLDGQR